MTIFEHVFHTPTMAVLQKGMEGTLVRTRVSMNNLANVDTPGFKRQTVAFEDRLKTALRGGGISGRTTHPDHLPIQGTGTVAGVRPMLETDLRTSFRADGNNVDIDQEMVSISNAAGANVRFTELLTRDLRLIQSAIRERV